MKQKLMVLIAVLCLGAMSITACSTNGKNNNSATDDRVDTKNNTIAPTDNAINNNERGAGNIDNDVNNRTDNIGNDVKNGAEDIGNDVKNGAEDIGNDVKNGAEDIGEGIKKGAEDIVGTTQPATTVSPAATDATATNVPR